MKQYSGPWRLEWTAPLIAGVLLALSFPPVHLPLLPFVALVPLALWVARRSADATGGRAALQGGFLFGAAHFGLLFHWVPLALIGPDPGARAVLFAALAFVVIVVGLAAMAAVFVWLLHHAVRTRGAPLWLALPVTWTALEWSRAHLPTSLALPWLGLGTSLTGIPELLGIAEIVGGRGVSFWIATVNGLLATWVLGLRERGGPRWTPVVATVVVATAPAAWGVWRAETLETRPAATIAVVQPNRAGRVKLADDAAAVGEEAAADQAAAVEADEGLAPVTGIPPRLVTDMGPSSPDLVVLPELFVRGDPRSPGVAGQMEALQAWGRRIDAPVLFGGLAVDSTEAGDVVRYNAVHLLLPDGLAGFRYDKRRLVPVVERIPLLPRRMTRGLDALGVYGVGEGWPLAEVRDVRYGALVCYESSYPEAARSLRRAGADVLVNVTNDAWLGGAGPMERTVALWQHPAHLVMRAVENRMGAVRAANTGFSLFVDPVGRVHDRTGLFVADSRVRSLRTTDVRTAFTRWGDVVGTVSALAAGGLLLLALMGTAMPAGGRRRRSPSLDPSGQDV